MLKQILIPVAAFAVTATAASAFNADMLEHIDVELTDNQISALEEAHELRISGADREEVRAHLEEAGIDRSTMHEIMEATREVRDTQREAIKTALDNDDYDAFLTAIADSPLADAIDSEADFETFKEAHERKEAGDFNGAEELLAELGIERPIGHGHRDGHGE